MHPWGEGCIKLIQGKEACLLFESKEVSKSQIVQPLLTIRKTRYFNLLKQILPTVLSVIVGKHPSQGDE